MFRRLIFISILSLLLVEALGLPSAAVGKYCLVYWREAGAYENQAPPAGEFGFHDYYVWVVDSNGNPMNGKAIKTSSGSLLGTTGTAGIDGYVDIPIYSTNNDIMVVDGSNLSDVTPIFNITRWPHPGHYSWEVMFMYFPDASIAPAFNHNWNGILNCVATDGCWTDAPCTRSLSYWSTDPTKACSDSFTTGSSSATVGQTFVATGDRIVAAKADCYADGWFQIQAKIRDGGPTGAQIGPTAVSNSTLSGQYSKRIIKWGINDVAVTPGNTYFLEISKVGGGSLTASYCGNNYASGNYYEGTNSYAARDLMGLVAQAYVGYASKGRISGYVRTTGGSGLAGAVVTTSTGGYNAQTNKNGFYTMFDVAPGTYDLTAKIEGYADVTLKQRTVVAGQTKQVDFKLTPVANLLQNPGFESDMANWTLYNGDLSPNTGTYATLPRTGSKYCGKVVSGGTVSGILYQTIAVQQGFEYKVGTWAFTDSWDGTNRSNEYPTNVYVRAGADGTGGTNPNNPYTVTWTAWQYPYMVYADMSVKKTATSSNVTIFLSALTTLSKLWNKVGFDDAYVVRSVPSVVVHTEPSVTNLGATSATINWGTNIASDSRVDFGETTSYGRTATNSNLVTNHSLEISGLAPSTLYHFKVTSAASGYNSDSSDDYTFTTTAAPQIQITSGPSAGQRRATSAVITWTTDVASTSRVDYGETTNYGLFVEDPNPVKNHSLTVPGLSPGMTYHFRVKSTAPGCLDAVSGDSTFATLPRATIGQLKAAYSDGTQVELPPEIATAASGVVEGGFYVEELDRSSGIRVVSGESVQEGEQVVVVGTLGTANGERVLNAALIERGSTGNTPAGLVAAPIRALFSGAPMMGLLVKTCGRVQQKGSGYFSIADGWSQTIKVVSGSLAQPPDNAYVVVSGVCGAPDGGGIALFPRRQSDIIVL